jgi:hypothetical protein
MDQLLSFLFSFCIGFLSGYGVRAMISLRHRREARNIGEASARLKRVRASKNPAVSPPGPTEPLQS